MPWPKTAELIQRRVMIWHWVYRNRKGHFTAKEIAAETGVHQKTVLHDLAALMAPPLNVPIWYDLSKKWWKVGAGASLPPLTLKLAEAVNLYLALRLLNKHADRALPEVKATFDQLASILPLPIGEHVARTAAAIIDTPRDEVFSDVFAKVTTAWAERTRVRIEYPSTSGGPTGKNQWRQFEPYFIEPSLVGHSCYVIGRDVKLDEIRTFKIERIVKVVSTQKRFDLPPDWSPADYLKGLWDIYGGDEAEIRIRFSRWVASRVRETLWHPSQKCTPESDGGLLVTFRVRGIVEITPWILSWGDEAEVLAPDELRANIGRIAKRQASLY